MLIRKQAYARAGLIGNPSDGYFGKTISFIIRDFRAEVVLFESPELHLELNERDESTFESIEELARKVRQFGYYGGIRLLKASVKRFFEYCTKHAIPLHGRNFTLRYSSNIPPQVGMAGSSAIITACWRALMEFYTVEIPKHLLPSLVLSVENDELGIPAGLQDRVIQCYEGCMFMNFERSLVEGRGYGEYERLPVANLPYLWLAYLSDPSNSGKIHSNVKARWLAGDPVIHEGMKRFAQLTDEGRTALLDKDWPTLGRLMNANFALRRQLYGDDCIGQAALAMIAVAQEAGVPVKFPGSGGAVVGMCESDAQRQHVRELYESRGYVFAALVPHEPSQP
jgi:glucuronokinase